MRKIYEDKIRFDTSKTISMDQQFVYKLKLSKHSFFIEFI